MLQSQLFTKTRKEAPTDEVSKNAQLLIRAGFIDKLHSGVYTYLPLGLRVFKNIENIIRDEMTKVGGQEILMPSLHPKENWEKTGRWNTMDDLYKITDTSGKEFGLGPTHEEIVVPLVKQFVSSYRDLPLSVFQIQNKFRMELRAKSGILRGREFVMKDMYSFHKDEDDLARFYKVMEEVYRNIFKRVGLGSSTYFTFASGGSFSKYSHEFQTITPAGEDTIYICESCSVAVNSEIIKEQDSCPNCGNKELRQERAIEVGNIFELKTKFTKAFDLTYKDENDEEKLVLMGCYGIGIGRIMGTLAEVLSDDSGLVWTNDVAPFKIHLIELNGGEEVREYAVDLYEELQKKGIEVLYDDRKKVSAGEKFADSDLFGVPHRVIISKKTLESGKLELKDRKSGKISMIDKEEVLKF